jgi:uncharacterized membrane protein YdfJ with MMPL/SSD domain
VAALADLALRRPWALLVGNLAVLALALILAAGAPGRLGIGLPALDRGGAGPDLVVATRGRTPVHSGPYQVALRVIVAQLRSDPGVASVRPGPVSADRRSTSLLATLAPGDEVNRQRTFDRVRREIDPGPLRVSYGGDVATALEARHDVWGDLWKLELLVVPFGLLMLVIAVGPRLAVAPVICAATAIAGCLAGLRLAGELADVSLLGIAPGAILGLALGVEAPCLLVARFRDEAAAVPGREAVSRTIAEAREVAPPLVIGAIAATAGLLATGLDQAPSIVLGCALAACLALGSALVCVPATLALFGADSTDVTDSQGEPPLAGVPRTVAGRLAGTPTRTAVAGALVIAIMAAAAVPLLEAKSRPFSAADLPSGSQAAEVAAIAGGGGAAAGAEAKPGAADRSLFGELPLAAAISAAALALTLAVALSPRAIPVAIVSLLPAAAACGLCVLVFQEGHLSGAIGQRGQGALETGAVASLVAAIAAISASRAVIAIRATRSESSFGLGPELAAETAAAFTVPAAICATLVVAAATAVLAGTDLYAARELGLAVAVGLLLDLVLLRVPLISALARWGGSG